MAKALCTLFALLFVCYSTATAQTDARADIPLLQRADSARIFGSETAEFIIDEYIDFACGDCQQFYLTKGDSLKALVEEQDVIFILRVYPIPRLLRGYQAAEAAFCAAALVMVIVYVIPHSARGTELDYELLEQGVPPSEALKSGRED